MISYRKLSPEEILQRIIAVDIASTLPIKDVFGLDPEFVNILDVEDKNGNIETVYELNYKFLVFEAHLNRIYKLLSHFQPKTEKKIIV